MIDKKKSEIFGFERIKEILPHRYPFLYVDKVIHLDLEADEIIAQKNNTINEHFFQGHFPQVPIMPGVLIIEALAQTGGILVYEKGHHNKIALLMNITNAKFRRPIRPGDVIDLYAKGLHISNTGGKIKAKASVDNILCVEAQLSFVLIDKNQL
jgi:3-hydroxyacyl-[acyl-carrier-protein] dehydratase